MAISFTRLLAALLLWGGSGALTSWGCGDEGRRPLGASCDDSGQCTSNLCTAGRCVDPLADEDGDGLTNELEARIGSDLASRDSDGDGRDDPDELDSSLAIVDTDGDGKPDIIESATADADADCVTDQYDSDDLAPTTDVSAMVEAVCPLQGLCAEQREALRATCPDGANARCVLDDVTGYAEPELACDGVDENCDGTADEGFVSGCRTAPPFIGVGSGGHRVATDRYRALLIVAPPATATTRTTRHEFRLGANPGVSPRLTPSKDAGASP